jgi:hypothetical protein
MVQPNVIVERVGILPCIREVLDVLIFFLISLGGVRLRVHLVRRPLLAYCTSPG